MFNSFCYYLNVLHLSLVAEVLRRIVGAVTPTVYKDYGHVGVGAPHGHYKGWVESSIGVVAFVQDKGTFQWRS